MLRVAVALAVAGQALAADFAFDEGVLVLNQDNFDEAVAKYDPLLVEFYAPWCGHCKTLAPQYAKAAKQLKKLDPPLYIAKVDATQEEELAERFGIRGYPTLKFFRSGKPTDYEGGRTAEEIVSYVRKRSGPASASLSTGAEVDSFLAANSKVAVLGYFADASSAARKAFEAAAGSVDGVSFAATSDAAVAARFGLSADGAVAVVKSDESETLAYDGAADDAEALANFVRANELPLVITFSQESARKLFAPDQPIRSHFLFFADAESDAFAAQMSTFTGVARANKGEALFVHVGADQERVMQYFDLSADELPTSVIVHFPQDAAMRKFRVPGSDLSAAALQSFLDGYQSGAIKPFLKSEEPPASNDEPVKVVVGKSFSSIVLDESKDVLLEFYAPWCGHCKSLAPKYEQLAKSLAGVPSVVIAKMDATGNEIDFPGVNVQGFPTLYFFPAGAKKAVEYDGGRTVEDMASFIQKHATHKFELPTDAASADGDDEGDDEEGGGKDEL